MSDSPTPSRQPTQEQWIEIQADLFAGRKIQAIKTYREASGLGLKEAKDAMEAYEARLRQEHPDRFTAAPSKGCVSTILLFLGVLTLAGAVVRIFS